MTASVLGGDRMLPDLRDHQGELHNEGRALSLSRALGEDVPPVELDEMANEGEPDARPRVRPGGRAVALAQPVEDIGQDVRVDALPRIGHDDLRVRPHPLRLDLDAPAARGELDGIAQQVPHHLAEPVGIAADGGPGRLQERVQPEPLRGGARTDGLQHLLDDIAEIDDLE